MRNGWLCEKFVECDEVTGVDVAEAAISDAKSRVPNVTFFAADFCSLDLPPARFDVALALEIFSHVPDQRGFVRQLAAVLKPRGHLILLTQNRLIYSRRSDIAPQGVGHVRCWVTMRQLRALVAPHFDVLRVYHGAERSSGLFAHGEFRQAQCSSVSGDTSPQDRLVKGTGWTRANAGHAGTAAR